MTLSAVRDPGIIVTVDASVSPHADLPGRGEIVAHSDFHAVAFAVGALGTCDGGVDSGAAAGEGQENGQGT